LFLNLVIHCGADGEYLKRFFSDKTAQDCVNLFFVCCNQELFPREFFVKYARIKGKLSVRYAAEKLLNWYEIK